MIEKISPQELKKKSTHRESSRKKYKKFIPQSKLLKKVEFQK